ncbi:hypothetical protein J5X84_19725 [Streptosporangiaceae bacterium NEAU-GS5]|nr:hypothetical protein [Streptosporangiaceae bacterium NEAU-GS5]
MAKRLAAPLIAAVLLGACSESAADGQQVDVVAQLAGSLSDLAVAKDGSPVVLVTQGERVEIWHGGKKIDVDPSVRGADEIGLAPDGSYYVSSTDGLYHVRADGTAARVAGGKRGFTADGGKADGPAGPISGVGVDPQGRVVYTESLTDGAVLLTLVRRIEADGTILTLMGRGGVVMPEAISAAADPPLGTKGVDLPLPGGYYKTLDVGADGTVFVSGKESVLALTPDGTVMPLVAGRFPKQVTTAQQPFDPEGKAVDASVSMYDPLVPPNISTDAGTIVLTSSDLGHAPAQAFRWVGSFSAAQKTMVDGVFNRLTTATTSWPRIRVVRSDGTVTTAAWGAKAAAVRGGRLYLAMTDKSAILITRVKLPANTQ